MPKSWGQMARESDKGRGGKSGGWGKPGGGGDHAGSTPRGKHAKPGKPSAWAPAGSRPKQGFWGWLTDSGNVKKDVKGAGKPAKGAHARGKPGGKGPDKLDQMFLPKWMQ